MPAASESLTLRCFDAIQQTIQRLTLSGLASTSIYQRKFPWGIEVTHPACILSPVTEQVKDATNESDDWALGVQITLTAAGNRSLTSNHDRLLMWRERIMLALHNQKLIGVEEVYIVKVEPGPPFDPFAFAAQYDATTMVARCWSRRNRSLSR